MKWLTKIVPIKLGLTIQDKISTSPSRKGSGLHNVQCLNKGRGLKRQDQGQPFPMRKDSDHQGGCGSQEDKPIQSFVLFFLLHEKIFVLYAVARRRRCKNKVGKLNAEMSF